MQIYFKPSTYTNTWHIEVKPGKLHMVSFDYDLEGRRFEIHIIQIVRMLQIVVGPKMFQMIKPLMIPTPNFG